MKDINIKGDNNMLEEAGTTIQQSRWKSKVLWTAIVTDLLGLVGLLGGYDFIGVPETKVQAICMILMSIATSIGLINNPSDKENL